MESLIHEIESLSQQILFLLDDRNNNVHDEEEDEERVGNNSHDDNGFLQRGRRYLRDLEKCLKTWQETSASPQQQQQQLCSSWSLNTLQRVLWILLYRLPIPSTMDGQDLCQNLLNRISHSWIQLASEDRGAVPPPPPPHHHRVQFLLRRMAQEYPMESMSGTKEQALLNQGQFLWCVRAINFCYESIKKSDSLALDNNDNNNNNNTATTMASDPILCHIPIILLQRVLYDCIQSLDSSQQHINKRAIELPRQEQPQQDDPRSVSQSYHILVHHLLEQIVQASIQRSGALSLEDWLLWQFFPHQGANTWEQRKVVGSFALQILEYTIGLVEMAQDKLDQVNLFFMQKNQCNDNMTATQTNTSQQHGPPKSQGCSKDDLEENDMVDPENEAGDLTSIVEACLQSMVLAMNALETLQHWQLEGLDRHYLLMQLWRTLCLNLLHVPSTGPGTLSQKDATTTTPNSKSSNHVTDTTYRILALLWCLTDTVLQQVLQHPEPQEQEQKLAQETPCLGMAMLRLLPYSTTLTMEYGDNVLWKVLHFLIVAPADNNNNNNNNAKENPIVPSSTDTNHPHESTISAHPRPEPLVCKSNAAAQELKHVLQVGLCHLVKEDPKQLLNCDQDCCQPTTSILHRLLPIAMAVSMTSTNQADVYDEIFEMEWNRIASSVRNVFLGTASLLEE